MWKQQKKLQEMLTRFWNFFLKEKNWSVSKNKKANNRLGKNIFSENDRLR